MTEKEQNKLAGTFLLIHGAMQALLMLFICTIYGVIGAAASFGGNRPGEPPVGIIFIAFAAVIFLFSMIFVIPQIIGGWKMLKEKPNARIWGIIGSIFACFSVPLGTAAGVFGLVFLFGEQGTRFYADENRNQNYLPHENYTMHASDYVNKSSDYVESPPPNSWR